MTKLEIFKEQQSEVFDSVAQLLSALASPVRIKLVHLLSQGPLTVEVLSIKIDQSIANTSMHLRKMLSSHIVQVSTMGKNRQYSLHPAVFPFWEAIQDFVQAVDPSLNIESKQWGDDLNWTESLKQTIKMAKKNEVLILDVRPTEEVAQPLDGINVLNLPSTEVAKNLAKLPKKKPVLVFCRGRFCALSAHVVEELRIKGIKAYRLNESWYSLKQSI